MSAPGHMAPRPRVRRQGLRATFDVVDRFRRVTRWCVVGEFRAHVRDVVVEHAWRQDDESAVLTERQLARSPLLALAIEALRTEAERLNGITIERRVEHAEAKRRAT